jgi:hypothetical protein
VRIYRLSLLVALGAPCAGGCASPSRVPPAADAVARYGQAVANGDVDALYGMMGTESRRAVSRQELARVLAEQKAELAEHAKALTAPERTIAERAQLRYPDGEIVALEVRDGQFFVEAASGLPAAARTPAQALGQLRSVMARRSYAGLLRVLTPRTRALLEGEMRSLVEGLAQPESLPLEVSGDVATAVVAGGHRVRLRREDGVWHVEDID